MEIDPIVLLLFFVIENIIQMKQLTLFHCAYGGMAVGKRNKSKRFIQQGNQSVSRHDERIPYRTTYAEAEAQKMANVKESSLGGI